MAIHINICHSIFFLILNGKDFIYYKLLWYVKFDNQLHAVSRTQQVGTGNLVLVLEDLRVEWQKSTPRFSIDTRAKKWKYKFK